VSEKESARLYNEEMISPSEYYKETEVEDRITFEERAGLIEKYVARGRMLDIGCNRGTFLKVARERGWECYGIDVNKNVKEECEESGIKFMAVSLEKVKLKQRYFRVVVMNDVVEHLHDPREAIRKVGKVIEKGGVLFMVTPDVGSVPARMLRGKWYHIKPNEHLVYFSRKTIRKLLEDAGFVVVEMRHAGRWRRMATIFEKSKGVVPGLHVLGKMLPERVLQKMLPFNVYDELCVVARRVK